QDKRLNKNNDMFTELIRKQLEKGTDINHQKYMYRKLKNIDNLQAFDLALETLEKENKDEVKVYLESLTPVFIDLTQIYLKKEELQAAYFPYIIKKYKLFFMTNNNIVLGTLLELVRHSSLYSRENAMEALYSIGNSEAVLKALKIINDSDYYHNDKLLCDGLLSFGGDKKELDESLWHDYHYFNENIQLVILEYFRFGNDGEKYIEQVFDVLSSSKRNSEVYYSCIRFFGKYPYYDAYRQILEGISDDKAGFELKTVAAAALGSYDYPETREVLIRLLHDRNWYVRNSAASSLRKLGVDYFDLIDIFDGDDRYAREIAAYSLKREKVKEREYANQG
ncbi:MAG: HEAT repeat domain-containing protein, partial [Erysipelotrichaceae bacterium]